jgi:hypothetical protein
MFTLLPLDVAAPSLLLGLGLLLWLVLLCLIIIIESAVLQLMRWGDFKRSLAGAIWMNLASTLFGLIFTLLANELGGFSLLISWALSVVIEALVLMRHKPGERRHNWLVALVANLASYLILILPAYLSRF